MKVQELEMANGVKIPQVGLGLWKVKDEAELSGAVMAALEAGYTHFDDAHAYGNEQWLGKAIQASKIPREQLFITTKIRSELIAIGQTRKSYEQSMERLGLQYVDLLLLHFPVPVQRKKAWKELEKIKAEGGAKSIGVSNYTIKHLEEMKLYATEMPVVNQVELHVFLQQPELVDYCRTAGIAIEAYSPLAHGKRMDDPVITDIATKHDKTYAQIMLRWGIENGLIILPKSTTPERVRENIALFDFELYLEDLQRITKLNRNMRTCWDPTHIP